MDAMKLAMRDIFFSIPEEILQRVFGPGRSLYLTDRAAVEAQIRTKVLEPKVRVDCNLVGATEVTIPLIGIVPQRISQFAVTFFIPKQMTNGRSITSVLAVTYGNPSSISYGSAMISNNMFSGDGYSHKLDVVNKIMDAHAPIADMGNTNAYLIGENLIAVEGYSTQLSYGYLRCLLAHDEVMSSLKPQAQTWFSELCVYAVKAYIYNHYYIKMDMGELSGGRELQSFKMIIEGYSDSAELYQEFLRTTWRKVSNLNDNERKWRMVKRMTGALS